MSDNERETYLVVTKPWEHGQELFVLLDSQTVGVSQTHTGEEPDVTVEDMARDYIASVLEVPEDGFDLKVIDLDELGILYASVFADLGNF